MKKIYYTYKVTLTGGKTLKDHYYFGKHETVNIKDGYKGSGKILKDYYKKYPDDYIFEILKFCTNRKELCHEEEKLISEHINEPFCVNILNGSFGGDNYSHLSDNEKHIRSKKLSEGVKKFYKEHPERRKELSEKMKGVPQGPMSKSHYENLCKAMEKRRGKDTWMKGKKHKPESKKLVSEHNWQKNPKFEYLKPIVYEKIRKARIGSKRMRKGDISTYVKPELVSQYLDNGWEFGGIPCKKRSDCPKRKWMKNNNDCIQVPEHLWNEYLNNGWVFGRNKNYGGKNKGMKKVQKNNEYRYIRPKDFEQYLSDGWFFCNP